MEFTDGQIAPCIQCGNSAIAHEIAVGGKRQILPVCNTCLDPAEQKKRLILVMQQQLDQLPPTDVAVCLYFSRHRDLLDPDVRANIAAHAPEDAPDPEVALTVVEGGQDVDNPVIIVAPGPDCDHQHVTVLVDQGDGLTRITCNDCDACAEVTSATLAACPGTLEVMLELPAPYYKEIDGRKYDRKLLELADQLTNTEGRIDRNGAARLFAACTDAGAYTAIEKATLRYIRDWYAWTDAGDHWFRAQIRSWAARR